MRAEPDISHVIASICARHKIRLDENDPAIITVEIARLALEESVDRLLERTSPLADRIRSAGIEFGKEVAVRASTRIQAETDLARQVIAEEAQTARKAAAVAIKEIAQSYHRQAAGKWIYLGMLLAAIIGLAAFAAGYACAQHREDPPTTRCSNGVR